MRKFLLPKTQYPLPFFLVVDHGADLRSEFFLHATNYGILLGAASASRTRRGTRGAVAFVLLRSHRRAGNDSEFYGAAQDSAGGGDGQTLRLGTEQHVDYSL